MKYLKKFQESSFHDFSNDQELFQYITYDNFEELMRKQPEEITNSEIKYCLDRVVYFLGVSNGKIKIREDGSPDLEMPVDSPIPSKFIYSVRPVKRYHTDEFRSGISLELDCDGYASDYYIIIYKFEDDWWLIEMMLPGEKGSDYFYVVCDGSDGIMSWSRSKFKFSDDQMY